MFIIFGIWYTLNKYDFDYIWKEILFYFSDFRLWIVKVIYNCRDISLFVGKAISPFIYLNKRPIVSVYMQYYLALVLTNIFKVQKMYSTNTISQYLFV